MRLTNHQLDIVTLVCYDLFVIKSAKEMAMTFEQFMRKVDGAISRKTGLSVYDFADAPWMHLYEDTCEGEEIKIEDVYETLAEYDDVFAEMLELVGPQYRTYKHEWTARKRRDALKAMDRTKLNIYCVVPAPDRSFRYCVALMWPNDGPLAGQVRAYCG